MLTVDMFFLKTCSFNGVTPRRINNRFYEGIFCIDPPEARHAIQPCNKQYCERCYPLLNETDIPAIRVFIDSLTNMNQF
jgi:hypothetical protein